ncbi:MAG: hypothetical protein IKX79_04225, partial [Desulfovibrionaceae bacterium]|nr:hypothetical protein [Desulfovibrionaceae bacterium]
MPYTAKIQEMSAAFALASQKFTHARVKKSAGERLDFKADFSPNTIKQESIMSSAAETQRTYALIGTGG